KQQAPADMAAAVRLAKVHSRAVRDEMKPEASTAAEINEVMAGEIRELKQKEATGKQIANSGQCTGDKEDNPGIGPEGKRAAPPLEGIGGGIDQRPSQGARQYGDTDVSGPTYCKAFVEEEESRILVDTGSSVTIISAKFFDKIAGKMKAKPILEKVVYQIQGVTGHLERPKGEVKNLPLKFKKNGITWELNACIMESATADIILGTNFLIKHKATLNMLEKQLVLSKANGMKETIPLVEKTHLHIRSVNIAEPMDIDPNPKWNCSKGKAYYRCMSTYIPDDMEDDREP
ncbi:1808_t:CDS:2, partial [Paraglomus brasilianum]